MYIYYATLGKLFMLKQSVLSEYTYFVLKLLI